MKVVLIESGARPSRRLGGGLASVVVHAALIGLALFATRATMQTVPVLAAEAPPITYVKPKPPPMAAIVPAAAVASSAPVFAAPVIPRISMPTIVPVGLPEINFEVAPMPDPSLYSGAGDPRPTGAVSVVGGGGGGTGTEGTGFWSGAELAMRIVTKPEPPRYPSQLQQNGIEGTVLLKFVVDTLGRIDPASIVVVESAHPQFTTAARATLDKFRFQPAVTVDGSKVRAAAIMPFVFRITR
jgi:TonB family protein